MQVRLSILPTRRSLDRVMYLPKQDGVADHKTTMICAGGLDRSAREKLIVTGGPQPNVPVRVPRVVVPVGSPRTGVRAVRARAAFIHVHPLRLLS